MARWRQGLCLLLPRGRPRSQAEEEQETRVWPLQQPGEWATEGRGLLPHGLPAWPLARPTCSR